MTRAAAFLFLAIVLATVCLPAIAVSLGRQTGSLRAALPEDQAGATEEMEEKACGHRQLKLYITQRQEIVTLDLEDYVAGVVMAEMPASFELEALKAQAVVARTYVLHQMRSNGGTGCNKGPQPADICSDSTHCQAWIDPEEKVKRWPEDQRDEYLEKVRRAVTETAGEVAVFQGELIEAVYHSTCAGRTETSAAIWSGGSVPYLQSVDCPFCPHSPYYRKELLLPMETLKAAFGPQMVLADGPGTSSPLEVISKTPGGRVGLLQVYNTRIEGIEVRRLLDLPSTNFTWETRGSGMLFVTRGHGHGVGMCQYGADGAAASGKTYREIIRHYYHGVEIISYPF